LYYWRPQGYGSSVLAQGEFGKNVAALENGSRFTATPPSYSPNSERTSFQKYSPDALLDLSPNVWCSKEGSKASFEFVIELAVLSDFCGVGSFEPTLYLLCYRFCNLFGNFRISFLPPKLWDCETTLYIKSIIVSL
jgi:hypothetical protein